MAVSKGRLDLVTAILSKLSAAQQKEIIKKPATGTFFQKQLQGVGNILGLSILCGFYDIFEYLITQGCDLDDQDCLSGNTFLHKHIHQNDIILIPFASIRRQTDVGSTHMMSI